MGGVRAIFFDVAHTLLEKPAVIPSLQKVLQEHGLSVSAKVLGERHRILMELITFPDETSRDSYREFNSSLVRGLGAIPDSSMLDDMFAACKGLPWVAFDDVAWLGGLQIKKGVLSNWDFTLQKRLIELTGLSFDWVLGSACEGLRKPNAAFFRRMLDVAGLRADEVAYVGDSIRLDIEPAVALGVRAILLDRHGLYPYSPLLRISRLDQLTSFL